MGKESLFISPSEIRTNGAQFGLTQKDLAIEMGTCASAISKWENGKVAPNPSSTRKLLDFFGLDKKSEVKVKPSLTFEEALKEAKTNPEVMTAESVRSASITIENHTADARSFFLDQDEAKQFYAGTEQKKISTKEVLSECIAKLLSVQSIEVGQGNLHLFKKLQSAVVTIAEAVEQYET